MMEEQDSEDIKPPPPFGAKAAAIIFTANLVVQVAMGFIMMLAIGYYYASIARAQGLHPTRDMIMKWEAQAFLPIGTLTVFLGTYVVFLILRRYFPGPIRAGVLEPIGWKSCSTRELLLSALGGISISIFMLQVLFRVFPPTSHTVLGPLVSAASVSKWGMVELAMIAVFVAPMSEEFIFRGAIYSALANSWGKLKAAVIVSVLFVGMHYFEVKGYPPAFISIAGLAVGAVYARERTGSLSAPVAVHTAYNLGVFANAALLHALR